MQQCRGAGARAMTWGMRAWVLGVIGAGSCAAGCGGKSKANDSQPHQPNEVIDASAHSGATDPSNTQSDDETVNSVAPIAEPTASTPQPLTSADGDVAAPTESAPTEGTRPTGSDPMGSTDVPSRDGGTNLPVPTHSAAGDDAPTPDLDAGAPVTPMLPEPSIDAGLGVPNVPTEFEVLPPQCVDSVADMSAGRCTTARSCAGESILFAACDSTVEDWGCRCLSDGRLLKFTDPELQSVCQASLTLCDPERARALSRHCEPDSSNSTDSSCSEDQACSTHFEAGGVVADTVPRIERAACSIVADTQRWQCNCMVDGDTWTSFVPEGAFDGCSSAFDMCQTFDTLVPELGAECSDLTDVVNDEACLRELDCQFQATLGGKRITTQARFEVSCQNEGSTLQCYLGTLGGAPNIIASPVQDLNEACRGFTADEIVGVASLPALPLE